MFVFYHKDHDLVLSIERGELPETLGRCRRVCAGGRPVSICDGEAEGGVHRRCSDLEQQPLCWVHKRLGHSRE
jgi:hypothetical protein